MPAKRADKQERRLFGKLMGDSDDRVLHQQIDLVQKEVFMLRELLTGHDERIIDIERRETGDSKDAARRIKDLEKSYSELKRTVGKIGPDGAAHRAERILKLEDTIEGLSRLIPDSDGAVRQYDKAKKEIMILRHDLDKLGAAIMKVDEKRSSKEEKDVSHLEGEVRKINDRLQKQGSVLERLENQMRELQEFAEGTEAFLDKRFEEEAQRLHALFDERERRLEAMTVPIVDHEQRAEKRLRHELDHVHDVLSTKEKLLEEQLLSLQKRLQSQITDTEQKISAHLEKVRQEENSKAAKRFTQLDKRLASAETHLMATFDKQKQRLERELSELEQREKDAAEKRIVELDRQMRSLDERSRKAALDVQEGLRDAEDRFGVVEQEVSAHRDIEEELLAAKEQDDIRTLAKYIETELLPVMELPEIADVLKEEGFPDHVMLPALQMVQERS